ncbi:MAG: hypothetical protein RL166_407 [Actinomycetota bacterium]|jgi:hypothetical protein
MKLQLNFSKKMASLAVAALLTLTFVSVDANTAAHAAAKPKLSIGRALVNGSPLALAMTSKYKNKTVTIELGTIVKKKLKYSRLTSVRLSSTGSATICATQLLPSTSVLRVKYGSSVITTTKTKTRASIAACPLAAPSALNLQDSDDSGVSNSDNITNATSLNLAGTAFPNSTVELFENGVATGNTATANTLGAFYFALSGLNTDGVRNYTTKASIAGLTSAASAALPVTVDRTKPTLSWTWVENEIGKFSTRHMNIVPSEPISGLEVSDILKPDGDAFTMIEITDLVKTGENYGFTVLAHEYEATDLSLKMFANAVTDLAGNESAGTYTYTNGLNAGRRVTFSPEIRLDYLAPRLASVYVEHVDSIVDYARLVVTFDEEVPALRLSNLEIQNYYGGYYNFPDPPSSSHLVSSISLDGTLSTLDRRTFKINVSSSWEERFTVGNGFGEYWAIGLPNPVADEYGNLMTVTIEPIPIGAWSLY